MFPSLRQWLVLAACVLILTPAARSQQTESRIVGRILDPSGAAMPAPASRLKSRSSRSSSSAGSTSSKVPASGRIRSRSM